MQNLAYELDRPDVHLQIGEVQGKSGRRFMILTGCGLIRADRSTGCLLEPKKGDKVLAVLAPPDQAYILNILEREDPEEKVVLSVDGSASLKVNGDLEFEADRIQMTGADNMTLNASEMNLNTINGHARFASFRFMGGLLDGRIAKVKTAAKYIDTTAERIVQRFKRSYRRVDELEESKIGRMRCLIKDLFYVRSKNTTLKSEKRVKVDGKKIMLG